MFVFTSCTNNYIPKARVLASTLKKFHPDWVFCLLLGENPPEGFTLSDEPFDRVMLFTQLGIPDYSAWLFRHRVVEICTAAKGPALCYFLEVENHEKVIYLDPDIMICNSLTPIEAWLDKYDILLTPHLLAPQPTEQAVRDNEQCALCHGVFNLGFVAASRREQGLDFARWWRERLMHYCYDDIPHGLFTDQRWCDLAPAFFPNLFIIRDPGYNAASWNLTDRIITKQSDGIFLANDSLLRFYHFTGFDSGAGEYMTQRYAKSMPAVGELWKIYKKLLMRFDHEKYRNFRWKFMKFDDGTPITDEMRLLYRERNDLQKAFPDPFLSAGYLQWYLKEHHPLDKPLSVGEKKSNICHFHSELPKIIKQFRNLKKNFAYHWVKSGGFPYAFPRIAQKLRSKINHQGLKNVLKSICKSPLGISYSQNALTGKSENTDNLLHLSQLFLDSHEYGKLQYLLHPDHEPVCIIEHDWGGGAEIYAQQRIKTYLAANRAVACVRYVIPSQSIELRIYFKEEKYYVRIDNIEELADIRFPHFKKIIINELAGWYFSLEPLNYNMLNDIKNSINTLILIKRTHNAFLEFIFHDFFSICPSITLIKNNHLFCGIPSIKECDDGAQCIGQGCIRGKFSMTSWRAAWTKLFEQTDKIIFFSENTYNLASKIYSFHKHQIALLPHQVALFPSTLEIPKDGPMRIAVVGDIHIHKGSEIVVKIGNLLKKHMPDASLIVFGNLHADNIPPNIKILGPYQRDNLPLLLEQERITIGLMPSVCPETYSFVTRELASLGLPLVSFNLGAQGDFIKKLPNSRICSEMTAESALSTLKELDSMRLKD